MEMCQQMEVLTSLPSFLLLPERKKGRKEERKKGRKEGEGRKVKEGRREGRKLKEGS